MRWAAETWLVAAPMLAIGVALLLALSARRGRSMLHKALATPLLAALTASVSESRRTLKRALLAASIFLIGIALARPQWGRETVELERTGVDVLIALDVSRSMLAGDAGGTNRLEAAREAVGHLLERLQGDRAGIIAFAGDASLVAPLTRDHSAVARAMRNLDPAAVSEQGSNLAKAIAKAGEGMKRGSEGPKALLVISDGEQLQGDAAAAARAASAAGMTVHCAGVGSAAGARIPVRSSEVGRFAKNQFGREVVSRMDARVLQQTASAGQGQFVRIEGRGSRVLADWFEQASARLPRTTETRESKDLRERYQWPLAIALFLLLGEWLLGDRRRANLAPRTL
jgi:Ca-activated chloride channel family protein